MPKRVWRDIESVGSLPARLMPKLLHLEDLEMRTDFDFTPYRRSTVGFDRLFDLLETGLRADMTEGYPPFDIVKEREDAYHITLAVAGFAPGDIEIVAQQNLLVVTGKRKEDDEGGEYLHRGIAGRPFERRFQLADFVEVSSANLENGLLRIVLQRVVPAAMKPRRIEVNGTSAHERITAQKDDVNQAA
jgi:molecular chaperone IbpA